MTTLTQKCQRTAKKVNRSKYAIAVYDAHGWADANDYKPIPYDIVILKTRNGKMFPGWWGKTVWQGARLRKDHEIIKWKRKRYDHFVQ